MLPFSKDLPLTDKSCSSESQTKISKFDLIFTKSKCLAEWFPRRITNSEMAFYTTRLQKHAGQKPALSWCELVSVGLIDQSESCALLKADTVRPWYFWRFHSRFATRKQAVLDGKINATKDLRLLTGLFVLWVQVLFDDSEKVCRSNPQSCTTLKNGSVSSLLHLGAQWPWGECQWHTSGKIDSMQQRIFVRTNHLLVPKVFCQPVAKSAVSAM